MTEKELYDLMGNFNPMLEPDDRFIERLERNLGVADTIKQATAEIHRASRRAAILSAIAGFVAGVIATLCAPWLLAVCVSLKNLIFYTAAQNIAGGPAPVVDPATATIFTCIVTSAFALLTSLQTYRLSSLSKTNVIKSIAQSALHLNHTKINK